MSEVDVTAKWRPHYERLVKIGEDALALMDTAPATDFPPDLRPHLERSLTSDRHMLADIDAGRLKITELVDG